MRNEGVRCRINKTINSAELGLLKKSKTKSIILPIFKRYQVRLLVQATLGCEVIVSNNFVFGKNCKISSNEIITKFFVVSGIQLHETLTGFLATKFLISLDIENGHATAFVEWTTVQEFSLKWRRGERIIVFNIFNQKPYKIMKI